MKRAQRQMLLAACLLGAAIGPVPASPASTATEQWRFTVYLDGKKIGYHNFTLAPTAQGKQLTSEARFTVRLLKIPVYRYSHDAVELWDGPCLERIEANTDDNGEQLSLRGQASGDNFMVSTASTPETLSGCVMSFAYWDSRILRANRLLNAQNGEYLQVQVSDLGADPLRLADDEVTARRYRLQGKDVLIDLWYSDDRDWLALQSKTPSGRTLYYERQNFHDE